MSRIRCCRVQAPAAPCELRDCLAVQGMGHTRGAPYPLTTQGRIERCHRSKTKRQTMERRKKEYLGRKTA